MRDLSTYFVGQLVNVRAFGRIYWGRVVKIGRKLVHVKYRTKGGVVHVKTFKPGTGTV